MISERGKHRVVHGTSILQGAVCLLLTLSGLVAGSSVAEEARVWKTADGQFQVTAAFVKVSDQAVVIRRADNGNEVTVLIELLSQADRDYVSKLANEQPPVEAKQDATFGWSKLAAAKELDLAPIEPVLVQGVPVVNEMPVGTISFNDKLANNRQVDKLRVLVVYMAAPQVLKEMRESMEKLGYGRAMTVHKGDIELLNDAIENFGTQSEKDAYEACRFNRKNEFEAADTMRHLLEAMDRKLAALAPQPPFELAFIYPLDLGDYNRQTGAFHWKPSNLFGLKLQAWGLRVSEVTFRYERNYVIPESLRISMEEARELLTALDGSKGILVAQARILKLGNQGADRAPFSNARIRHANIELVSVTLYATDDLHSPLHTWQIPANR